MSKKIDGLKLAEYFDELEKIISKMHSGEAKTAVIVWKQRLWLYLMSHAP
jgi:hypothetical protein